MYCMSDMAFWQIYGAFLRICRAFLKMMCLYVRLSALARARSFYQTPSALVGERLASVLAIIGAPVIAWLIGDVCACVCVCA